jgi:hypothetical protein
VIYLYLRLHAICSSGIFHVSSAQRFQVVRLAGQATASTCRLVAIRMTTWTIYRGQQSRRKSTSLCRRPEQQVAEQGRASRWRKSKLRQGRLASDAEQGRPLALGGVGHRRWAEQGDGMRDGSDWHGRAASGTRGR